MIYQIKRGPDTVVSVRAEGTKTTRLMGDEVVRMTFGLVESVEFQVDDFVTVHGTTYYLLESPEVEKVSTREWRYTLNFKSVKYRLNQVSLFFYDQNNILTVPDFFITGTAEEILDVVLLNANRVSSGWTKGAVDSTNAKTVQFDTINCLEALMRVATEFDLELWVSAQKVISFEKKAPNIRISLKYGQDEGLLNLIRRPMPDFHMVTKLYARGSEKNLPLNYRDGQKQLRMNVPYLARNVVDYGLFEYTKTFDDVFPERTGTVTGVDAGDPFVFSDSAMDFDLNEADNDGNTLILIPGLSAKVVFQTGQLAGYSLEIKEGGFDNSTKTFTLLQNMEEQHLEIPSENIRPAVGDEYILYDVQMPQSYIDAAELRLRMKAQVYLNKNSKPRYEYTANIDPLYLEREGIEFVLGGQVNVIENEWGLVSRLRITGIIQDVDNPYAVQLEFGNERKILQVFERATSVFDQIAQIGPIQGAVESLFSSLGSTNRHLQLLGNSIEERIIPDKEEIKWLSGSQIFPISAIPKSVIITVNGQEIGESQRNIYENSIEILDQLQSKDNVIIHYQEKI